MKYVHSLAHMTSTALDTPSTRRPYISRAQALAPKARRERVKEKA